MDIKSLKFFLAVAQFGSLCKAASSLHCVQSNVSARIRQLEDELGTPLFVRVSRGMVLTTVGETLVSYAERIIGLRDEAVQAVSLVTQGKGLLRIGTMESTLAIQLPKVLYDFTFKYSEIELDIHTGTTDSLLDDILNHRVHCAFIGGDIISPQINSTHIFTEEIVLITPKIIQDISECSLMKLLVFRQGCPYRSFGEQWLRENGLSPVKVTELGTLDGIFASVSAGIGITFLPKSVAINHFLHNNVRIHEIDSDRARFDVNLIVDSSVQSHPAFNLLVDMLS